MFQKAAHWSSEEEFRFVTVDVGIYRGRGAQYPLEAVEDVLVGMDMNATTTAAIVATAAVALPGIPVFRMAMQPGAFGFQLVLV